MKKDKYHLLSKRHNGKFVENALVNRERQAKKKKRQQRQGQTNSVWLRTRRRVLRKVLNG